MIEGGTLNWIRERKAIISGFSLYLLGSVITMILSLLINPFVSKAMSHEDFAIVGYFSSFSSLFTPFISFTFVSYYARYFFLFDAEKRELMKNTLLIALLFLSFILSFVTFGLFFLYSKFVEISFPIFPYAILQILSIYFGCFFTFMQMDLKMRRNPRKYFNLTVALGVLNFLSVLLFVVILKYGATGKLLVPVICSLLFIPYFFKNFISGWKFNKAIFIDALKFCMPLVIAGMFAYFFSGIDMFILEKKNDTFNLGLYSIGLMISGYLMVFGNSFGQTFQPDFFQAIATKNKLQIIKLTVVTIVVNTIPVILFIIMAPFIIDILTFGKYVDAAPYAQILSLRLIPYFVYFCFENVIIGLGYSKGLLTLKIAGLITSILVYFFLITNYSFYGAAWGQVFSYCILILLSMLFLFYKSRLVKRGI